MENDNRITDSKTYGFLKKIVRIAFISAAVAIAYGIITLSLKLIRENAMSYENVDEIIEKNYKIYPNTTYINDGDYYYLISENIFSNGKEELIVFKDNKYHAFDNIYKNIKDVGSNNALGYNRDNIENLSMFFIEILSYEDDYIIICYKSFDTDLHFLEDQYGYFETEIWNDKHYYFKVLSKVEVTDNYAVFATDLDDNKFEILTARDIRWSDKYR